jgi:enamine deaminase RidA (YjgF/YER057c/UK114 family)
MTKEYVNPPELFPSRQYGFSQVVKATAGTMVFVSGQVAWNERQEIVGPGDLGAQTRQAFQNVRIAIQAAGGTLADVVSMRIYIVARVMADSGAVREALLDFFPEDRMPTTTWIGVESLANEVFLIEIEPVAIVD